MISGHIVCPGLIYGFGEDILNFHLRSAWLGDPHQLPYIGEGDNVIPTIHVKDLVVLIELVSKGVVD
jgi:adenylate kinase